MEKSLAKFSEAAKPSSSEQARQSELSSNSGSSNTTELSLRTADLKNGQTQQDVEKKLGKPKDSINLKDSVVYIYPSGKVIFEKGQLVEVQYADGSSN